MINIDWPLQVEAIMDSSRSLLDTNPTWHVERAVGAQRLAAFSLLYSHLPSGERAAAVAKALGDARKGDLNLEWLLVASRDGSMDAAVLAQQAPGDLAFFWPPVLAPGCPETCVDELLRDLGRRFDEAGLAFSECLLEGGRGRDADRLQRNGFVHRGEMVLLDCPVDSATTATRRVPQVANVTPYRPELETWFANILGETLVQTLDWPFLSQARSPLQALRSHGLQSVAGPRGTVFHDREEPVALLLLTDRPEDETLEISYLGVVPSRRRRGWGGILLEAARNRARESGRSRLSVTCDASNNPAVKLYINNRFAERERRSVHVRLKEGPS